jgi:hypothetical protein
MARSAPTVPRMVALVPSTSAGGTSISARVDPLVDVGRRAVADRGEHRVDRHQPADHERDQEQAER